MKHIVMFSGGVGSWYTARRVAEQHGADNLVLLFADTLMEDEDLYRFLHEAAADVGGELRIIAEGRDPWQVFFDQRYLGNSRIDPCSLHLKRKFLRNYITEHFDPTADRIYLGIDWSEAHRFEKARRHWEPWNVAAPLCDPPFVTKEQMLADMQAVGIEIPRLYQLGFAHNNCGGFCIKAGHTHFKHLLAVLPERYAYHEQREQELREYLDKDVAILRDRSGGNVTPLTLRELRERVEAGAVVADSDWGGCGCFSPEG